MDTQLMILSTYGKTRIQFSWLRKEKKAGSYWFNETAGAFLLAGSSLRIKKTSNSIGDI
jgi:hypothetical protein